MEQPKNGIGESQNPGAQGSGGCADFPAEVEVAKRCGKNPAEVTWGPSRAPGNLLAVPKGGTFLVCPGAGGNSMNLCFLPKEGRIRRDSGRNSSLGGFGSGEVVDAPPSLGVPEVSLEPPGIVKVSLGGAG